MVTDHLGSTRMEANKSGSLAGIRRHDYLPFGEELVASTGAQRNGVGYEPPASNVKHKYDAYERDNETGLDFAQARYFSSVQGRFTSVDPLAESAELDEPQSWNRYSFVLNNPLVYTDPTGEKWAVQYANGQATFRWYDGDTIPSDWSGKWEEYKAGWYIGADAAIRLGTSATDVFILPKNVFDECCAGDWAKLQGADPPNLTPEQQSILYAATLLRINETQWFKRQQEMYEASAHILSMAVSPNKPVGTSLSPSVQRKLGNLASRASEKVADVIRSRGGNASNIKEAGPWAQKTLAETAKAAVQGNAEAVKAIKIAKQARRKGQEH